MRRCLPSSSGFRSFLFASRSLTCKALVYGSNGNPSDVVKLTEHPVPELGPEDVSVSMLMSPINPSDINQIQGVYALKPPLPAVGGGEGVGEVTKVGAEVTSLRRGDLVVPARPGLGTWRALLVCGSRQFLKITDGVPLHTAATISINPPTAYRMLKCFVNLKPGDCVVQNGANSGVGQSVIQLAAVWGIKTINIVRNRPNMSEMKSYLEDLGATEVINEEDSANSDGMKKLFERHGQPILGFNCVGGKSASNVMKHLAPKSTLVTYGGMSLRPLTVGTGTLIFKDLRIVGYWNSKWLETNANGEEHCRIMSELCSLAKKGKLRPPLCTEYSLTEGNHHIALEKSMESYIGKKQILVMKS